MALSSCLVYVFMVRFPAFCSCTFLDLRVTVRNQLMHIENKGQNKGYGSVSPFSQDVLFLE